MSIERCEWTALGASEAEALRALCDGFNASQYYGAEAFLSRATPETVSEQYGASVCALRVGE